MATSENGLTPTKANRRRWQFKLKSLLVGFVVLSILLGWVSIAFQRAAAQRSIVAEIHHDLGGVVVYDASFNRPPLPRWLCNLLGRDFYSHVISVSFRLRDEMHFNTRVDDDAIEHLTRLTQLVTLDLSNTEVTDASNKNLKKLTNLRTLNLAGTKFTDDGARRLQRSLPNCKIDR